MDWLWQFGNANYLLRNVLWFQMTHKFLSNSRCIIYNDVFQMDTHW